MITKLNLYIKYCTDSLYYYTTFSGRVSRSEYQNLIFNLVMINLFIVLDLLFLKIFFADSPYFFFQNLFLFFIILFQCFIFPTMTVRRFHDTNESGWKFWTIMKKGDPEANQYGAPSLMRSINLNWSLIYGITCYYLLAKNFFRESLLLFQDGQYGVPFYYEYLTALTDPAIDFLSFWLPVLFSFLVFSGIYYLNIGSFNPIQSDRNSQLVFLVALIPFIVYFVFQLLYLNQTDKSWYFGLEYMAENSGFQLSNDWPWETELQDSRWKFYAVGISNAVRVVLLSIFLSTIIGTFFGVARLSTNLVLSKIAEAYVEFFRNMPLVVQLFFWLTMLGDILPRHNEMWIFWDWFYISNRTIMFPRIILDSTFFFLIAISCFIGFRVYTNYLDKDGVDDSEEGLRHRMYLWFGILLTFSIFLKLAFTLEQPELVKPNPRAYGTWNFNGGEEISVPFIAMMIGLTIYTSVQIAEIVRGSIQSLPRGQVEAAISLGLSPFQRLRLVILPQALRSMIPPMNNQYLNCWKNSSLAIIISFSDHFAVTLTIVNNAGQAVPAFMMLLITYQIGSLLISAIMNYLNSRVTSVKI